MARINMELTATAGLFDDKIQFVWDTVLRGDTLSREQRAEMRMVVSHIAKKCHDAVNELALVAGSRGTFLSSPVQRFQRDINALATHAIFEYDHVAAIHGGTFLGVDIPPNAMI